MLAINHATLATALTLGASIYYNQPFFLPFIAFVVFAAIAPDIDHPNSELGRHFKFIAAPLPHRGITHSFLGVAVFGGGLYFLLGYDKILTYILLGFSIVGILFLEKILLSSTRKIKKWTFDMMSEKQLDFLIRISGFVLNTFLLILIFLVWKEQFRKEILVLLTFGYLAHIIGDFVTIEGVPLLWPIKKKFGLRLFETGKTIEGIIGFALIFVNAYLLYRFYTQFGLQNNVYWNSYLTF